MKPSIPNTRRVLVATGAAVAVAVAAAPASAAPVRLAPKGGTTLKLDASAAKALKSLGVKVAPTGKAKAGTAGITFPITGGRIDPASAAGLITHSGGISLSAGRVKVTLSDYNVIIGKASTLTSKVNGGARAKLLLPVVGKAKVTRSGLATNASNIALHLTSAGAAALNKAFGVKAFKPKLKLGTLTVRTQPTEVAFAGGRTDLALDSGAVAALTSLGVAPGLAPGTTTNTDGSLAFPITGGVVNATSLAGTVGHSGGITLTKGATTITLTDFLVDTTRKTLAAKVNGGADRVEVLDLDLSAPQVAIAGRTVTVGNVQAKLTAAAAGALNQAFGTTAFTPGLLLGTATVRGAAA
ncbi:hypothetical protein DSM112329_01159 [Paraconexibacter sp. AEG42_29]|uniref:Htaa domain-containing protein n=1 Tax=Paraconexibacter sp. AEG42_29 TaxID=2997339 RepID=A0AAU7AS59_9ACTN